MNAQQLNVKQIHQRIPHDLLYSDEPQDFEEFSLSDRATNDDSVWEEFEEYESDDILMELNDAQFISSDY